MFAQPALGGGFYKPRDHEGHLVLITRVVAKDRHFDEMKAAEIDRLTVDIVDLDGDGQLEVNTFLTHAGIVNKVNLTGPTLGRIGQEKFKKGMGFSLLPFTPGQDDAKAQAWLAGHPDVDLTSPPPAVRATVAAPATTTTAGSGSWQQDQLGATTTVSLNDMRTVGNLSEQQRAAAVAAGQFTNEPPF